MHLLPWQWNALSYAWAYLYSVLVGTLIITPVLDEFYCGHELGRSTEKWRSKLVGMVERALYTSSWLSGAPGFLAIWLALKVAGQWERWKADWSSAQRRQEAQAKTDTSRAMYAGYLLGNALSIAYGFIGGMIGQLALEHQWPEALVLTFVAPFATAILYVYIQCQVRKKLLDTSAPATTLPDHPPRTGSYA